VTKTFSFGDKLGLAPETTCVAFDFWNQSLLGVFKDHLAAEIVGHDTRVILLHPFLNHPQLIGNSRHISGSYSIRELAWDNSARALEGASETIPDRMYTLFVYVPDKAGLSTAHAATEKGSEVAVRCQKTGKLLSVSFPGNPEVVHWKIEFNAATNL
jgi:hypothetical protein